VPKKYFCEDGDGVKATVEHLALKREADKIALLRLEAAARTEQDFKYLIKTWDRIDENRERRERRGEILCAEDSLKRMFAEGEVIPSPIAHIWWRQIVRGNFNDVIFDCPLEIQELTTNTDIFLAVKKLNDGQKEVLYYTAIREWTPQRVAMLRGQTDRNIRKVYSTMIASLRRKLEVRK